ncbi:MAG: hypothetical protein P1V97_12035 [Planctomycetota bacterium]|nr:hypothetical protein [Planctomycetota bacterium]
MGLIDGIHRDGKHPEGKDRSLTIKIMYVGPVGAGRRTSLRAIGELWKQPVQCEARSWGPVSFVESAVLLRGPTGLDIGLRVECPWRVPQLPKEFAACFAEVDGLIFVADSQLRSLEANQRALNDLNSGFERVGRSLGRIPHAFQWNKCEMPDAILPQDLGRRLNRHGAPSASSTALLNLNVTELLLEHSGQIIERLGMTLPPEKYSVERLRKAVGRKRWPLNE